MYYTYQCRLYKNKTYQECVFCTGWDSNKYYRFINNDASSTSTISCEVKEANDIGELEESYLLVDDLKLLVSSCPDDYKY